MRKILTSITVTLTHFRQKCIDVFPQTQIYLVNSNSAADVPTIQITKHFPKEADYPLNKWHAVSSMECMDMLKN